jgi:hypothetical protein
LKMIKLDRNVECQLQLAQLFAKVMWQVNGNNPSIS